MGAWRSGRVEDYRVEGSRFAPSLCYLVFSGHGALNVKLHTLETLRYICVTARAETSSSSYLFISPRAGLHFLGFFFLRDDIFTHFYITTLKLAT